MSNIAIINNFGLNRIDYARYLKNNQEKVYFFTREKYVEYYSQYFENVFGYENMNDFLDKILMDIIKMNDKVHFERIVSLNEFDILEVGGLRSYLGVAGQSYSSALEFRDKFIMKSKLKGIVGVPKFSLINNIFDLHDFICMAGYPVVIKPRLGAGSMGVQVIRSAIELDNYLSNKLEKNLMIEAFVEGEMYHLDGAYNKNELMLYVPSKYVNSCLSFNNGKYLGSITLMEEEPLYLLLKNELLKVLNTLETPMNLMSFHAEFFVTSNDEIIFCEIGSRVGGGMIQELIKEKFNINLLVQSMIAQLPKEYHEESLITKEISYNNKQLGWIIIPPKKGVLKEVEIAQFNWIKDYIYNESVIGKSYKRATSSVDAIIIYLVCGDTEEQIKLRMEELVEWQEKHTVWEG